MAVSGQDRLDGFVGEMFPKIVNTESSGRERKLPTETGDATSIKERHTAGRIVILMKVSVSKSCRIISEFRILRLPQNTE